MILGTTLLALALIATVSTGILFLWAGRTSPELASDGRARLARGFAVVSSIFAVGASVYLAYLIDTHQFQYAYVAQYSARRSAGRYLLAAFWGGQEGSILLWTFWTSVLGAVLAFKAGGREARVWPIFAVVQSTLLALVLTNSPFRLGTGPTPADGQGLNPLLENQWMVIHPPILFLGFASLAIPWAWALYGLIYRDWDGWLRRAFPWTLFSFAVHGFGVALGGYWAYETLGWGGFWGWDPVENSSLVPWLFITAFLHAASIQRANGGSKASNLILATLPFALMSYGTFLTRTGILADFSVHSFSAMGKSGYDVLLGEVIGSAVLPVMLLALRYRSIPKPAAYTKTATREFGFFLAAIVLGLVGLLTAVGMSAPLITKLWIAKGAAAQPDFYNQATYPLAILMLLIMAVSPYLAWRSGKVDGLLRRLLPAIIVAIASTLVFFALGGHKPWMLLLFGTSTFAVISNIFLLAPRIRRRETRMSIGGHIAHVGAALVLAGIACLVAFSRQALHISLTKDRPVAALGYRLTYLGMTSQPFDRSNALRVRVEKDGHAWEATPHLFIAPWGGAEQLFANPPDIRNFLWGDLYLAHYHGPTSLTPHCPNDGVDVHPNDIITYGEYKFTYHGLKWSDQVDNALAFGGSDAVAKLPQVRIHADIDVTYRGTTQSVHPSMVFDQVHMSKYSDPVPLPGAPNAVISLDDVKLPGDASISTSNLPDPTETVQLDLSTKPMIWLVWLGTALYTLGGLIAYRRRAREFLCKDAGDLDIEVSSPTDDRIAVAP